MFFLLFLLALFSSEIEGKSLFDGAWKLDMANSIGSMDEILKLAGVNYFKRLAIMRLQVTESYEIRESSQSLRFMRDAGPIHTEQIFPFGQAIKVDDPTLGSGKQTVTYDGKRRLTTRVDQENGSVFHSTKTILEGQDNRIVYVMNYTTSEGHANCVRYFLRSGK